VFRIVIPAFSKAFAHHETQEDMIQAFRRSHRHLFSPLAWRVRLGFWVAALLVGTLGVGFALSADYVTSLHKRLIDLSPWFTLIAAPFGLAALVWFTERFVPEAGGSGIPQAIAALQVGRSSGLRSRLLSPLVGGAKMLLTLLGLLIGASIGREGPTIHVGAAVMYTAARLCRFPAHYLEKALILGGSAAGLSAAFNTPLAGIVFAIEELHRDYQESTSGIVLTSVIFAGFTSLILLGNYAYFGEAHTTLDMGKAWLVIPICGVVGGFLGGAFSRTIVIGSRRVLGLRRAHPWMFGLACGLVIAVIGLLTHGHSYGTGYGEARALLGNGQGEMANYEGGMLSPVFKFVATVVSYLSGIPGGLFSPSLATGAELGGAMTHFVTFAPAATVILLAMTAYFAGVVQTPITTFVIVMEMTDNNGLLVPLMATSLIAFACSRLVCPEPIYSALARSYFGHGGTKEPTSGVPSPGNRAAASGEVADSDNEKAAASARTA
jgi:H+/Cl- antiporter ClcA